MKFLRLADDSLVASDLIADIGKARPNERASHADLRDIVLKDGRAVTAYAHEVDDLVNFPAFLIPADAGTYELLIDDADLNTDGPTISYTRVPVIAWAVSASNYLAPITALGMPLLNDPSRPIVLATGEVAIIDDQIFDSIADYIEAKKRPLGARG